MAKQDSDVSFLPLFLDAYRIPRADKFVGLLSGYLKHFQQADSELWETTLDLMAADSSLVGLVPEVTWRTGISDEPGKRILQLARDGAIGPGHLRMWAFGIEIRNLPSSLFDKWIAYLLESTDPASKTIALDLFHRFYTDENNLEVIPSELAKKVLLHPDYFENRSRNGMDDYNWSEVAKRLITQEPSSGVELLRRTLERWTSYDSSFGTTPNRASALLYEIVRDFPKQSWAVISEQIGKRKGVQAWLIMNWFQGHSEVLEDQSFSPFNYLSFDDVAKWINKSKKGRSRLLARYVPKSVNSPVGDFTRAFISRYGSEKEVRSELLANFFSVGFSGEASVFYQGTLNNIVKIREVEGDSNIRRFLDEYIESLKHQVEHFKLREELESD